MPSLFAFPSEEEGGSRRLTDEVVYITLARDRREQFTLRQQQFIYQSPSRLHRQPPLHKGAFPYSPFTRGYAQFILPRAFLYPKRLFRSAYHFSRVLLLVPSFPRVVVLLFPRFPRVVVPRVVVLLFLLFPRIYLPCE